MSLLAGSAPGQVQDQSPVVCACFSVRRKAIESAIKEHDLSSTAEIGNHLKAGTGCGSCIPEIAKILFVHSNEQTHGLALLSQ
jgi:assimilatory nitrate reductase catalytic subunit